MNDECLIFGFMVLFKRVITLFQTGIFVLLISSSLPTQAQVPFTKGVNLTNWFQASSANEIQFTKFTRKDLERIKSLGCDVIRLPINLHAMTSGEPDYTLDPLFLTFLDKVVTWAEELDLHLILDNHTFDPAVNTSPDVGTILVKVWTQMAAHYKSRSDHIYYEVLNEPHGISDSEWSDIQQTVIDAIRTEDAGHYIVVGGANWNSYNTLDELPVYTDEKLIYTFHFYDPFIFTHQGASWTDPSMVPLAGVPFPYNAGAMPETPAALKGTWIEGAINNYSAEGTAEKVKSLIDIAASFKNSRNVPVFCGEFGVYMPNSDNDHRVAWYELVRKYLEEKEIAWTLWDYTGAFGLFENGSNELFDHDLNVPLLEALEMNVPSQQPYVKKPVTKGFLIYDDFIEEGIVDGSISANGVRNFYDGTSPKAGDYCLYWTEADQYGTVGFDFKPDLDLSLLESHDHTIAFWVRTNSSSTKTDIRFIDTKAGENDRPWRMGKTIDQTITGDEAWQRIEIPLKDLEEKGAWDNAWYNAEGKFDWTAIDRFEIVAEHHALNGIRFWFDDIRISGEDVPYEEEEPPVTAVPAETAPLNFSIAPNPVSGNASFYFSLNRPGAVQISICPVAGQEIITLKTPALAPGNHNVVWDGTKDGRKLAPGLYIVKMKSRDQWSVKKMLIR